MNMNYSSRKLDALKTSTTQENTQHRIQQSGSTCIKSSAPWRSPWKPKDNKLLMKRNTVRFESTCNGCSMGLNYLEDKQANIRHVRLPLETVQGAKIFYQRHIRVLRPKLTDSQLNLSLCYSSSESLMK